MNHRSIIKILIVVVIVVTVVWSVANVHDYAAHFHNGPMVWTLGLSVGMANAISVYSFVIARTRSVKVAAVTGILLFGVTSGMLQTFLYVVNGAPVLAAIAFGWFGPVAEGVLSWLHASLSEEQEPTRKAQPATQRTQKIAPAAGTQPASQPATGATQPAITERARIAAELAAQEIPQREIADKLGVSVRTVQLDLKAVREASLSTNGKEHI